MKKTITLLAVIMMATVASAQKRNITGTVTNGETREGLPGVSVFIKDSQTGTTTNSSGKFSLSIPDNNNVILSITSTGFSAMEVAVGNQTDLQITLQASAQRLEEIIAVGYGTVRKKDLTGSVISVKSDEIMKVPASNAMESLQGKLPGVDIVRTSGAAGSKVAVTVRGNRSVNASNSPLYIIDGIQYDNYQDINSNDIQSMEVLKDASSTAIYGSKGANGVILITTKKGASGKVKISANTYYGVSDVAGYPVPMTGPQYADLKRQAYRTSGIWNSTADDSKVFTSAADLAAVNDKTSVYWPGLLLHKGSQQDYGVGVAGGNERTKVYFSFDYFREKGLLKNDFSGRYSLRFNVDQRISTTFKVGLQSQLTYYDQNLRADNLLTVANKIVPFYTPYNADGSLAKFPGNANQFNPLLEDLPGAYVNKTNTTRILTTVYGEWKPITGLSIRSNLGIINASSRNGFFEDANTIDRALSSGSLSRITNEKDVNLTWENIINYQRKFNDHKIDITAVTSYLSNRTDGAIASGTGQLLASQSFYALQNNPANLSISSNYVGSNLMSGSFRVNYGFQDKYLLTVTGRADGASVLAPQNRWSFFPSVAAAWRIIDEDFMKNQNLFSDLKLRASYGVAGNSAVRPYQTQSGIVLIPFSWNDQTALAYGLDPQIGNPDLNWELTATQNLGIDFSLLKNRITASVDYYDSKTHDLLYPMPLPATTGGQKILANVGKTRNTGYEVLLRTLNIETKNLSWSSEFSYTRNKERIVFLPGDQNDIAAGLFIGSPVTSFYDYQKEGIWQTADTAKARTFGYKAGDIRVKDIDGDGKITALNDRIVLGSAVPKYSFGFNNDVKFKDFDFNIYVYARVGQMFVSDYANKFEPNAIENGANVDYWTPENPTNSYPRPNVNISRAALPFATTLGYEDGTFVKIRTVTIGYNLSQSIAERIKVSKVRLYVSAKNYFSFSKVKDYDPEGNGSFERPLTKLLIAGLNIDL
jgi:TonB-linked SusC/RagA family outer membrane protein